MIVETPMQPYKIDKICDQCQSGVMQCRGQNLDQYVHQCPECQFSELHPVAYPYMSFKEIKQ